MEELGTEVTRGVPRSEGGTPALRKSAAYEVDYLQLVAFGKVGGRPIGSRDNISVQFHRYSVLLHAELFDQQGKGGWREGLFLPVDDDFHYNDFRK